MSYGMLTQPSFTRPHGHARTVFKLAHRHGVAGLTDYERNELRKLLAVRWSSYPFATRQERKRWQRELDEYDKRQRANGR